MSLAWPFQCKALGQCCGGTAHRMGTNFTLPWGGEGLGAPWGACPAAIPYTTHQLRRGEDHPCASDKGLSGSPVHWGPGKTMPIRNPIPQAHGNTVYPHSTVIRGLHEIMN